jgi:hypothetical protein
VRRAILLFVAALALAAPSSASALVVGIADQKPDMFTDERFSDLGVRHARINVAWDAMNHGWEVEELDRWMSAAREAGVQPLVSFGHSRLKRRALPTPERFKWEFRQFRARYPWVTTFATWNEANHCGEPTCHRERLVAAYYRKLRQECRRCTVLAAELLDMPNMLAWAKRFTRYVRRYKMGQPRYWGLHNYVEANRFRTTSIKRLLRTVKGQVWLTEVGGVVKRRVKKRFTVKRIPESKWHAQRVTRFVLNDVAPLSRRITRVYLYHWNSETARDTWDSALIDHRGRRRPAFRELHEVMDRLEQRALRRAKRRR